ncbi:MAG TPA: copper resistance protein CopC [Pyrinomonadaceae bacterium]|nr:copper resistance protein CopC [Pyrinomonadaceae bacterium]
MAFSSLIRAVLIFIGSVLLVFGTWDKLRPRGRYESSSPKPGSVLSRAPELVTIQFSDALDWESELSVVSTITLEPNGEAIFEDGEPVIVHGPSPENPRALNILMPSDKRPGLYWVRWRVVTARGKAARFGSFCFGVGMPIPEHITRETPGGFSERDERERSYRAVLLGGLLLVVLGVVFPRVSRSRWPISG